MQQSILEQLDRFTRRVCQTGNVWILHDGNDCATTIAHDFEDDYGDSPELLCFWSSEDAARARAEDEWENYSPTPIPIGNFIEKWCTRMADDGVIAGIDLDENMNGPEREPLQLLLDIITELKRTNKNVTLVKFKNITEIVEYVKRALDL
ncbi:MAG: DUF2750 domain-containing protein [Odoribacteraceae bacterium]|jgi:hypothetical protein|nr:DUF2750 domain-containing protein [Odoribacteraceae bacterium]